MMRPSNVSNAECEKMLLHFLSAVCWVEGAEALIDSIGGGNLPRPMGRAKRFGNVIRKEFELEYLPELKTLDYDLRSLLCAKVAVRISPRTHLSRSTVLWSLQ
jgi:hypothetical protein